MHYVLSAKTETGSPVGLVSDAALYDRYYDDVKPVKFGFFPWYASATDCKLPKGLCLITKAKHYNFGIRSLRYNIYIASEGFMSAVKELAVPYEVAQPIDVKTRAGKDAVSEQYYAVRFPYIPFTKAVDVENSIFSEDTHHRRFTLLKIRDDLATNLFLVEDVDPTHSTLMCSQSFVKRCKHAKLKGITFIEESEARWQGDFDFLLNMGKKTDSNVVQRV